MINIKSAKEQKKIYNKKIVLQILYKNWYKLISKEINTNNCISIEIGSGSGSIQSFLPQVYKSDITFNKWLDLTLSAENLPFKNNSITNIVLIDVLHHISNPEKFFIEIIKVLKKGGKTIILEPYGSPLSLPIFKFLHHEPFVFKKNILKKPTNFTCPNQAASQIIFKKELKQFQYYYGKHLKILKFSILPTIIYPLSGGYKKFSLVPNWSLNFLSYLEKILTPFSKLFSFRSLIIIEKK